MRILLKLSLPLFVLDQLTKWWILGRFAPPPPHEGIWIIDGWFEITRVHNQGVAFGLGNGQPWANWLFGFISAGAFVAIFLLMRRGFFPGKCGHLAAALLLAGIPGNLIDRLVHGYVVDFVHVRLPLYDKIVPSSFGWWPAFNVAEPRETRRQVMACRPDSRRQPLSGARGTGRFHGFLPLTPTLARKRERERGSQFHRHVEWPPSPRLRGEGRGRGRLRLLMHGPGSIRRLMDCGWSPAPCYADGAGTD